MITKPGYGDLTSYSDGTARVLAGPAALRAVPDILDELGATRVIVVTSPSIARLPAVADLVGHLPGRARVFAEAAPLVPDTVVSAALDVATEWLPDAVLGIGGGSAIDTAKALALTLAEGTDWDALRVTYDPVSGLRVPHLTRPKLPVVAVPVTPSGAEGTASTSVNLTSAGRKISVLDAACRPSVVIHDWTVAAATPTRLLARAAMNGLANALEKAYSRHSSPYSAARCLIGARLLARGLDALATEGAGHGQDRGRAAGDLLAGGYLAVIDFVDDGKDFSRVRTGVAHAVAHAITGSTEVAHGDCYSVLAVPAIRFNRDAAPAMIAEFAHLIGTPGGQDPVAAIGDAYARWHGHFGLPHRLRDLGVGEDRLPALAEASLGHFALSGNPRPVRASQDVLDLLRDAW